MMIEGRTRNNDWVAQINPDFSWQVYRGGAIGVDGEGAAVSLDSAKSRCQKAICDYHNMTVAKLKEEIIESRFQVLEGRRDPGNWSEIVDYVRLVWRD